MVIPRTLAALATGLSLFIAAPASAQFFLKSADLAGAPVTGEEPGMTGPALPGATGEELRAALVWNMRAALNVAALQCQFEPTLLTLSNYNALLKDHEVELRNSYGTLEKYFVRTMKNKKEGQTELDKFGTRVYSGYSTVSSQLSFCQTAASIGHDALFLKRGDLGKFAQTRMRELRNSLAPWGDQARGLDYRRDVIHTITFPPFSNDKCWKKDSYVAKKCGVLASN